MVKIEHPINITVLIHKNESPFNALSKRIDRMAHLNHFAKVFLKTFRYVLENCNGGAKNKLTHGTVFLKYYFEIFRKNGVIWKLIFSASFIFLKLSIFFSGNFVGNFQANENSKFLWNLFCRNTDFCGNVCCRIFDFCGNFFFGEFLIFVGFFLQNSWFLSKFFLRNCWLLGIFFAEFLIFVEIGFVKFLIFVKLFFDAEFLILAKFYFLQNSWVL